MKKVLSCLLLIMVCLTLSGCKDNSENKRKEKDSVTDKYGTTEKVTVFDTIDKFNVELSNNDMKYFANNDFMIAQDGLYWYGIYDDITCYVKPVTFSNDIKTDITNTIAIRYDVGSKNEELALDYVKYLIKANEPSFSDEEIAKLIKEAKTNSKDKKTATIGKGITLGLLITDEIIEYQVVRIYK